MKHVITGNILTRINHIGNSLNFSENHCFAVAESLCLHFVVMSDERFYDDRL